MSKAKLLAIGWARWALWLFFSCLYPVFFLVFMVGQVGEWFISFYEGYKQDTTALLASFDEQLKSKK